MRRLLVTLGRALIRLGTPTTFKVSDDPLAETVVVDAEGNVKWGYHEVSRETLDAIYLKAKEKRRECVPSKLLGWRLEIGSDGTLEIGCQTVPFDTLAKIRETSLLMR